MEWKKILEIMEDMHQFLHIDGEFIAADGSIGKKFVIKEIIMMIYNWEAKRYQRILSRKMLQLAGDYDGRGNWWNDWSNDR